MEQKLLPQPYATVTIATLTDDGVINLTGFQTTNQSDGPFMLAPTSILSLRQVMELLKAQMYLLQKLKRFSRV